MGKVVLKCLARNARQSVLLDLMGKCPPEEAQNLPTGVSDPGGLSLKAILETYLQERPQTYVQIFLHLASAGSLKPSESFHYIPNKIWK